jgi:peroxiredoxin
MIRLLFAFLLFPATAWSFQPAGKGIPAAGYVTLVCKLVEVPPQGDSISVYEQIGLASRLVAKGGRRASDQAFVVQVPASKPKFYGVGFTSSSLARVILGEEKEVTLWGNGIFMDKSRTVQSPANAAYESCIRRIEQYRTESAELRRQFFNAPGVSASAEGKAIVERIARLTKAKSAYLDSLKKASPMLWRVASLHVTPEYLHEQPAKVNDQEFFGREFFRHAQLSDPVLYEETPDVFSAYEAYVRQLLPLGLNEDKLKQFVEAQVAKAKAGSRTHRMALGGVVSGFKAANHVLYPIYAKQYLDQYRNLSLGEIGPLEFDLKRFATYTTGMEAPDLAGMTPDSQMYSLKQLRGKVVLIDFWASWCGPCRKENPNVKVEYEKYKSKGFDILGVSLDRDAPAWKRAIAQDGLPWHHISDLKGWQSQHAQLYSVTSIPHTVLLDREGKIIARNLRGEQLGQKLAEIFGE